MSLANVTIHQIKQPSGKQVDNAIALFVDLMKDDTALKSLVGGETSQIGAIGRAMLLAGILAGEYYEATDESGGLVGFLMTMPSGRDLFDTEDQRALGLTQFMANLSEAGKEYYRTTYLVDFPAFVNQCLGPTGRKDCWYIHMLMVSRDHQGKGIGKSLVNQIKEKAAKNGDTVGISTTTPTNAVIYQKMGLTLHDQRTMPSPWGEWPLYILSLKMPLKSDERATELI